MANIHYQISAANPHAHLFAVQLTIPNPNPDGQGLWLPNWIPGSYMIRDFSKNIVSISAQNSRGEPVNIQKISKNHWQLAPTQGSVDIHYQVYAWDLSVRAAHFDQSHAYFNGTSVFLAVKEQEQNPCDVTIDKGAHPYAADWKVATSMARNANTVLFADGLYHAENYDDLIDHPVEIADFSYQAFTVAGIRHHVVLTGKHYCDMARLSADLEKICQTQISFFGEAPFKEYWFMTLVTGNDYGGLEHRASTSLVCPRNELPTRTTGEFDKNYLNYLTLCSHEYFHSWNIKRIKPAPFLPYQLDQESYTTQLWAFEGFTSYYEALLVHRAGLISAEQFINYFAEKITRVLKSPGRLQQTLADSSFDAWTKFYKQDDNALNAIISYYTKGAMFALALDLTIRSQSHQQFSLDDVMRQLWQTFGKVNKGVADGDIQALCEHFAGGSLEALFTEWLHTANDPDLTTLLSQFGVTCKLGFGKSFADLGGDFASLNEKPICTLGARTASDTYGAKLTHLLSDACAMNAGLAAGDVIIAINNLKVTSDTINTVINQFEQGEEFAIAAFRRDELMQFTATATLAIHDVWAAKITHPERLHNWLQAPKL